MASTGIAGYLQFYTIWMDQWNEALHSMWARSHDIHVYILNDYWKAVESWSTAKSSWILLYRGTLPVHSLLLWTWWCGTCLNPFVGWLYLAFSREHHRSAWLPLGRPEHCPWAGFGESCVSRVLYRFSKCLVCWMQFADKKWIAKRSEKWNGEQGDVGSVPNKRRGQKLELLRSSGSVICCENGTIWGGYHPLLNAYAV